MANETLADLEDLFQLCMDEMEKGKPNEVLDIDEATLRQYIANAGDMVNRVASSRPDMTGQLGFLAGMLTGLKLQQIRDQQP